MLLNIKGDINNLVSSVISWLNDSSNERAFWLIIFFGGILIFVIVYSLLNKKK